MSINKTKVVGIRLSDTEYQTLLEKASSDKSKPSIYMKKIFFNYEKDRDERLDKLSKDMEEVKNALVNFQIELSTIAETYTYFTAVTLNRLQPNYQSREEVSKAEKSRDENIAKIKTRLRKYYNKQLDNPLDWGKENEQKL